MAAGRTRLTVSLPARTARRVKALARMRAQSTSRVLSELAEAGLSLQERQREEFHSLLERYRSASDAREAERLGEELGRALFGR